MEASAVATRAAARPRALRLAALALLLALTAGCGKQQQLSPLDQARRAADRSPSSLEAQLALGRALYGAGQYNDAYIALARAHDLAPQDAEAAYELARTCLALGDSTNGIPMAQAALAANPRHAGAATTLARFYVRMGKQRDAETYLRKALENDPRDAEAAADLALVQRALGDKQAGLATARQAVALDPASIPARYALAELLESTGDLAGAERELRSILKSDPEAAPAMLRLAMVLVRRPGTLDEVRKLAKAARDIDPGEGTAAALAAEALYRLGKTDDAMQEFEMACRANPYNFRLWLAFANHLREQGQDEAADKAMQFALQATPRAAVSAKERKAIADRLAKSARGHEVLPGSVADMLSKPDAGITQGGQAPPARPGHAPRNRGIRVVR
jgi:tetratricopeptide (TPR) repeat protein